MTQIFKSQVLGSSQMFTWTRGDHVQRIDFRDNGYTLAWNIHYQIFVKTVCKMTCYRVVSHKTLSKRKNSRERYHEIYHNQHIYILFEHYQKDNITWLSCFNIIHMNASHILCLRGSPGFKAKVGPTKSLW